uniref:Uncharacterized protein n=1 Tax=Magnetococcus massalia (strain MO-1) TaxID=451514 RepID=A0A1S7LGZ3_MAGMO|nr:conserved exported protein of unknown function [Candidatus Magnetococcus massalia]
MKLSKKVMGLTGAVLMSGMMAMPAMSEEAAEATATAPAFEAQMPYFPGYYNPYTANVAHPFAAMAGEEAKIPFNQGPYRFQRTLMENQFKLHRKLMEDQYNMYKKLMTKKAFMGPDGEDLQKQIMEQQDKMHKQMMENHDRMQKQLMEQMDSVKEQQPAMTAPYPLPWGGQQAPWARHHPMMPAPAAQ